MESIDIQDNVIAQLGNKAQHELLAYSSAEQKAVKAAIQTFRENPEFKTFDTIIALGAGKAVISFLDDDGIPMVVQK